MKLFLIAALAFPLLRALPASAATTTSVSPLSARPGDTFKLVANTVCTDGTATTPLDKDSVSISGNEVTLTFLSGNDCTATYTAVVTAKPLNRELAVNLKSKAGAALGAFTFRITDIAPGPIPPGIDAQVDAMWTIMSERNCADEFGSRLARRYFCLNVTLGNNSGYPLIIASIGFLRGAGESSYRDSTASYLSARATVQQEHIYSARNLTLRALQNAGVIVAGFAPFAATPGRKGRIGIWSALIGTAASAWDGFMPDSTLTQAARLDDAALRDGRVIPNNSPARFAVFVDREEIKPLLLLSADDLRERARISEAAAKDLQTRAESTTNLELKSNIASEADKLKHSAAKDRADAAKLGSTGIQSAKKQNPLNPLSRAKAPLEDDLQAVRRALGKLIIVGDQIQYLQRVQVDASAVNPEIIPEPRVNSSSPAAAPDSTHNIVLFGKWLAKADVSAQKCSPTFETAADPTGTSLTLKGFTLKTCAETTIPLLISNPGGSVVYNLPVTQKPQGTAAKTDTVTISATGKVTLIVTGKFLTGAKVVVTLKNATDSKPVTPDTPPEITDSTITIALTIPVDYRIAGTTAEVKVDALDPVKFTLKPADTPTLVAPTAAVTITKQTAVFALKGTKLLDAKPTVILKTKDGKSATYPPSDKSLKVTDPKDASLTVTLSNIDAAYLAAGSTATITVNTDAGDSNSVTFKLKAPPAK